MYSKQMEFPFSFASQSDNDMNEVDYKSYFQTLDENYGQENEDRYTSIMQNDKERCKTEIGNNDKESRSEKIAKKIGNSNNKCNSCDFVGRDKFQVNEHNL